MFPCHGSYFSSFGCVSNKIDSNYLSISNHCFKVVGGDVAAQELARLEPCFLHQLPDQRSHTRHSRGRFNEHRVAEEERGQAMVEGDDERMEIGQNS